MTALKAQVVDIYGRRIFPAIVSIEGRRIVSITETEEDEDMRGYILPGFIDAHIHIESSMMSPSFFAHEAVKHGTVGTVSDPHEIANVCGVAGVDFMLQDAASCPLKIAFGAPSCVPATAFETAGATLSADDVARLLNKDNIYYLAEVMNFPGVMKGDESLLSMIAHAKKVGKPVDGHAPQLRWPEINDYFSKGISTDHECTTIEEAREKLSAGCKILIREGSAAKNYERLAPLIDDHWNDLMFCSDDKHPDELVTGHINALVSRSVRAGYDVYHVLKMACVNPVEHYHLPIGLLREGDAADFIIVEDLDTFRVLETWIEGECVYSEGEVHFTPAVPDVINQFNVSRQYEREDFELRCLSDDGYADVAVIGANDGQLITERLAWRLPVEQGIVQNDVEHDVLKCAVVNRYVEAPPSIAFIKNIGLKKGAIVSSVAHDSHNIIVAGTDDASIAQAVNTVIKYKGGMAYVNEDVTQCIPLEIAGLMTRQEASKLAEEYTALNHIVKENGCRLSAPFMTLSFMALPVIPHLKITDRGLFDVDRFSFL